MNQENPKKGQKTVKTHQAPSSVHCSVLSAVLSSRRLCATLQRGLSRKLLGCFELLFLVSFKIILPSILASELMLPSLLGNLSTLGTRPGISKEGSLLLKTEIPEEHSCATIWAEKKTKILIPPVCWGELWGWLDLLIMVQESHSWTKLQVHLLCGKQILYIYITNYIHMFVYV